MSFSIHFTGEEWFDEGIPYAKFCLDLDGRRECEISDLTVWKKPNYQRQWASELHHVCTTRNSGALITSIHSLEEAFRIWVWTMHKDAGKVYFQERILFMLEPGSAFQVEHVHEQIGDFEAKSEDGTDISTWIVPLPSIQAFVESLRP